mmetsp:Transcript_11372/g.36375  ORF Transcript_11372/g.36375 Transcript_11372/m.36375 type:complete len:220 (+) Transcript_11372:73-732(+)
MAEQAEHGATADVVAPEAPPAEAAPPPAAPAAKISPVGECAPLPHTVAGKIATANDLKAQGNEMFKAGELGKAASKYRTVFAYVNGLVHSSDAMNQYATKADRLTDEQQEAVTALKLSVNLNLAAVYIKQGKFDKAATVARKAIEIDADNAKAHLRLGQALMGTKSFDEAKKSLVHGAKLAPQEKLIRAELERWKQESAEWRAANKANAAKMFGGVFNQ